MGRAVVHRPATGRKWLARIRRGGNDPGMPVAASVSLESRPEVHAPAGTLRGTWEQGVAVFRGIPFAEAPVDELRFAAPRPVPGWDGVREAVAYGPPPPQAAAFGSPAF